MKIHAAVVSIERTVTEAQSAINKHFSGDIAHAQVRVELEGMWQVLKLLASAIDDEGVAVREPLDVPTRAEIEAIVKKASDRAAEHTGGRRGRRR
ncbi:hypothetical protein [Microbacterium xylanilyticum]